MDRFTYTNDPQDRPLTFIQKCGCNGGKCKESIHFGDECFEYDGDLFASEECLLWAIGANKVYAGTEVLV